MCKEDEDISVIAKMVLVSEKEKRDALARVMAERDIAVCAGKIFCNQLVAMTSDPEDHEKFLGMYQTAKKIAEKKPASKTQTDGAWACADRTCLRSTAPWGLEPVRRPPGLLSSP